jgi:hypothetical protein
MSQLMHFMASHPDAGLAGPRPFDADGRVQGSARRDPSAWTGLFGRVAPLTRLFPNNPIRRRELPALSVVRDEAVRVDWVSGACIVARRTAWEQAGLLDERFFLFWEDADWGRRVREAGWGVYYVPSARGTHVVGISRAGHRLASVVDFHRECPPLLLQAPPDLDAPSPGDARRNGTPGEPGPAVGPGVPAVPPRRLRAHAGRLVRRCPANGAIPSPRLVVPA